MSTCSPPLQMDHPPSSCQGSAYPFPHRPSGGKCGKEACWLLYAQHVGIHCAECPNALHWQENHGQRGFPGESFFECKLESQAHPSMKDCPFWS